MSIKTQVDQTREMLDSKTRKTQELEKFFKSERVKILLIELGELGLLREDYSKPAILHEKNDYRLHLIRSNVLRLDKYIERTEYLQTGRIFGLIPSYENVDFSRWREEFILEIKNDFGGISVTIVNKNLDLDAVLKVLEEIFFAED